MERLVIERLEFQGRVGILAEERRTTQPIGVDLEMAYPLHAFDTAAGSDQIAKAVDYAKVAERIVQIGTAREYNLLETLADQISRMVFAEFPVANIRLWVRKLIPPVTDVRGSVGVRVERTHAAQLLDPAPARFLMDHVDRLPKGRVLDLAAGSGRNALYLAGLGYEVEAVDRNEQALKDLTTLARQRGLSNVMTRTVELEEDAAPPEFGKERYDIIAVFFYLHRPLFPSLLQALAPGGMLIYETFLIDNHLHRQHPRRKEFCLAHNELLRLASGLRVLVYAEGEHAGGHGEEGAFTAQLLAQKEP